MLSVQPGNAAGVLEAVLERETDIEAAVEESYALLSASNGTRFPSVVAAARRLTPDSPAAFVNAVARYREPPLDWRLAAVRGLPLTARVLRGFISLASRREAPIVETLGRRAMADAGQQPEDFPLRGELMVQ